MERGFADADGWVGPYGGEFDVSGHLIGRASGYIFDAGALRVLPDDFYRAGVDIYRPDMRAGRFEGHCEGNWSPAAAQIEQIAFLRWRWNFS